MASVLVVFLSFCGAVANAAFEGLILEADKPLERVAVSDETTIYCCYRWKQNPTVSWIMINHTNITKYSLVNLTSKLEKRPDEIKCHSLFLKSVSLNDTGFYQCELRTASFQIHTHGTFLQVYIPLQKTLNLSESVKNSIITAEGVLLLMCVLIPGTMILCKSKRLKDLERKKGREEENIYEGLNLDDCNSAYHQIQRTSQQGPYQDVANCTEDIQLEKP